MPQLPWLDEQLRFPPVERALREPNGLLAAGGDLSPARLLAAYRAGIFPWYELPQPILWWAPDPRTVLFPGDVHISRSLRKLLRRETYHVTADQAFEQVIAGCAALSLRRPGTWITDEMADAYTELYDRGIAHSVECWLEGRLVGGLYGVAQGAVFFGESMFSREANASKVALVHLAGQLRAWGYELIDCQIGNPHLTNMGATEIPRSEFSALLSNLVDRPMPGGIWQLDWDPLQALQDSEPT